MQSAVSAPPVVSNHIVIVGASCARAEEARFKPAIARSGTNRSRETERNHDVRAFRDVRNDMRTILFEAARRQDGKSARYWLVVVAPPLDARDSGQADSRTMRSCWRR